MIRTIFALVCAAFSLHAQTTATRAPFDKDAFAASMSFEAEHPNGRPTGWGGGQPETIAVDDKVVHGGRWSVRLDRQESQSQPPFSTLTRSLPIDFAGRTIELRGWIRTQDVTEFVGLWMREDGDTPGLQFDNMQTRQVKGTTDWVEYSIVLPVHPDAKQVFFGFLIAGKGVAWVDDLQLLVDGKPIWEAPAAVRVPTVLDKDKQFDSASSQPTLTTLSPIQIENLQLLGKVWGFLKYHHPHVTSGNSHWDYELFRALPAVLNEPGHAGNRIREWIDKLGVVPNCDPCAELDESKIHLRPKIEWIKDTKLLGGEELSQRLQTIYRNRPANGKQFYVSISLNIGNPNFDRELAYKQITQADSGYQLLALYRMWNIIEYWFPYRDVLHEDWDAVLKEFIPRVALAKNPATYKREMIALIAKVHDTHANLWSSLDVRPPEGACMAPLNARFIAGKPVIVGYSHPEAGPATMLKPGDFIESIDGVSVSTLVERWLPYYAASNEPTQLRDISRMMTRGACGDTALGIRRGEESLEVKVARMPMSHLKPAATHDLPGDTFRKLSDHVAYLKLSSVKAADAAKYVEAASGTKGLIIDIRNYPSEFMVFSLGQLLVDQKVPFARFTSGDASNPGAFHWGPNVELTPQQPHYSGKVVVLVDEVSQSQAEYTTMAFRASSRTTVVGSTTAGADGNVSRIPLPGGLSSMISGIGVFYPDKRPTQRVGIIPDIEAKPMIEGIRDGRDEVLERAIAVILGPDAPETEIRKLAKSQSR